nr:hypothetical protein [Tanacetum cinerariifolium]
ADVPLLGELGAICEPLGAEVDEPMVDSVIDTLAELIVEVDEQMVASVMDMKENLVVLFGDDEDSSDDDSKGSDGNEEVITVSDDEVADSIAIGEIGSRVSTIKDQMQVKASQIVQVDDKEVWEMDEEWLMAPVTPPSKPVMSPMSTYAIEGSSTAAAEGHSLALLAPGVPMVQVMSGLEQVRDHVELGQQAATQKDEMIAGLSQQVHTLQVDVQHRDMQIQQLQTLFAEMSSREGTLM